MIIFESTLTTFEASFIFWGSWGIIKNWLELKIEPPLADLALLNPWNTLYNECQLCKFNLVLKNVISGSLLTTFWKRGLFVAAGELTTAFAQAENETFIQAYLNLGYEVLHNSVFLTWIFCHELKQGFSNFLSCNP